MAVSQNVSRDFHQLSYDRHAEHWKTIAEDDSWKKVVSTWFDETTADYWLHNRLYEAAEHLTEPGDRWLTIGDGRFGLDSVQLRRRGASYALPTDITDATLKEAKARGIIDDYRVENAEKLSFPDRSFDFVFCKEAFHHLPRPFLALYEMLRVCKKGVVLVEPQDQDRSLAMRAIFQMKRLVSGRRHFDETRYEDSGNYIYAVSRRELEKTCLGINIPYIAFKEKTNVYVQGAEFERARLQSPKFLRMRATIAANNILAGLGLSKHNILMSCILKMEPSAEVRGRLSRHGWKLIELPRNPYTA
jgi:ubiquinone/menaquinone biosynthesis C-methylase UbiE